MEPITAKLIEVAASNGFVALLLVAALLFSYWLVRYVLRINEEREDRYIKIIDTLTKEIKADLSDIKEDIKHLFRQGACD